MRRLVGCARSEAAATAAHAAAREQLEEQALKLAHLESEREMRQAQAQELERREQRFYGSWSRR